jgi:hypothetical protein
MIEISVVVPVKDEAGNVVPLAQEIGAALGRQRYEMIFVDDGSSDSTTAELLSVRGSCRCGGLPWTQSRAEPRGAYRRARGSERR